MPEKAVPVIGDNPICIKAMRMLLHPAARAPEACGTDIGMALARANRPSLLLATVQLPEGDATMAESSATSRPLTDAAAEHVQPQPCG